MKILVITTRFPFPIVRGDIRRLYHHIAYLGKHHEIYLMALIDHNEQKKWIKELEPYCKDVQTFLLPKFLSYFNVIISLLTKYPAQMHYFYSNAFRQLVNRVVELNEIDVGYVFLLRSVTAIKDIKNIPLVLDYQDCFSENMRQRGRRSHNFIIRGLWNIEAAKTMYWEKNAAKVFQKRTVISEIDRLLLPEKEDVIVLPNGVDCKKFIPALINQRGKMELLFHGNMSYFANIEAVKAFCLEVWPSVKRKFPDVRFTIVGDCPVPEVLKLQEDPSITVTGFVESLVPYLQHATIGVYYMVNGTGMQNKILEAMASGLPVVTTSYGVHGLAQDKEKFLRIADTKKEFIEQIISLLRDEDMRINLSINARRYVEDKYSWEKVGADLEVILNNAVLEYSHRCK
jgi:polysaccharide biosynthesis protein PslH